MVRVPCALCNSQISLLIAVQCAPSAPFMLCYQHVHMINISSCRMFKLAWSLQGKFHPIRKLNNTCHSDEMPNFLRSYIQIYAEMILFTLIKIDFVVSFSWLPAQCDYLEPLFSVMQLFVCA
jgi:hypothetical protein